MRDFCAFLSVRAAREMSLSRAVRCRMAGDCDDRRYADVRGGGGHFPERPSPPSARAAERVLQAAGLAGAAEAARLLSVRKAVEAVEACKR